MEQENEANNVNTEVEKNEIQILQDAKRKNNKIRMIIVIAFILLFAVISYIQLRGSYLEYLELGEKYVEVLKTNMTYKYSIMGVNFIIVYGIIYFTNRGIKKGLKPFFEKEKKEVPKLPNKSIALVISTILSAVIASIFTQKIMLIQSGVSFGSNDPVFGLDISYFVFQKPLIEMLVFYFVAFVVGLTLYTALYYVIAFNKYFDGVEGTMLKESLFIKKITRNILFIAFGISLLILLNTQNIVFGKIITVNDEVELVGAGLTESTIKLWGYVIFAVIMFVFVYRAIRSFRKGNTNKVLKNLAVIPAYLVILFFVMLGFDLIFVNSNELDKEKTYIAENINNTKNAYGINIEEISLDDSGTITEDEVNENQSIISNIPIITQNVVLNTLEDNQTEKGYYVYNNVKLANYTIDGKSRLVYLAPREIKSTGRTYNSKTYEFTHGNGEIIVSASTSTESGSIEYIQKDTKGKDEKIEINEDDIYFGLETDDIIATNAKTVEEYDYTDAQGVDQTSSYSGEAGLNLNFLDRLVLGLEKGDIKLAFSGEITSESKILMNRNVIQRAKKSLPDLIYDEEPYTVITEEGRIVWVIDAYTVSSSYPYSQYTTIEYNGVKQNINYIRNSIKVIVDAYDGTMSYYITDRTDPIAMAYWKLYPSLFEDLDAEIPEDISSHFVYPTYLYNVQAEILKVYHNTKTDILYRGDDLWDWAKYNSTKSTKGTYLESYYTMVNDGEDEKIGLIQLFTPEDKQNIISYLVGTTNGSKNELKLYKFTADSNILGPMQLDNQINEDEAISEELETINTTGTKITKQMIIVPIENTLLYVEPIYQTMLNESQVPILKKVIVASGNKLAIGDDLESALNNLLSTYAVNIEIENTDDLDGIIEAIIKANNNLTQSNSNNDWEMVGKDIKKLQELIDSLETAKKEEDKKDDENQKIEEEDDDENEIVEQNEE